MLIPEEVARLEEPRAAGMLAASARESVAWAGGTIGYSEPDSWQNQVMGAGLAGPVSEAEIDAMVEFYESRGVEPRLELTPFVDRNLITGLAARSFTLREFQNVLWRDLADELPEPPLGNPEGVTITIVDPADAVAVDALIAVSISGFLPIGAPIPEPFRDASRRLLALPRTRGFLARIGDVAVGGGLLDLGESAGALGGTSVLPEHRRRGIQQALMVARMRSAKSHGCKIATIDSLPGIPTERNAMRLGFAMAYTKVVLARAGEGLTATP